MIKNPKSMTWDFVFENNLKLNYYNNSPKQRMLNYKSIDYMLCLHYYKITGRAK